MSDFVQPLDPKGELTSFCQRRYRHVPFYKETNINAAAGGPFLSTVAIIRGEGRPNLEFVGQLSNSKKEAQKSAAFAALSELGAASDGEASGLETPSSLTSATGVVQGMKSDKTRLYELIQDLHKTTPKDLISYKHIEGTSFQCILRVTLLDGDTREYEGELKSSQKDAEQSAASVALRELEALRSPRAIPAPPLPAHVMADQLEPSVTGK